MWRYGSRSQHQIGWQLTSELRPVQGVLIVTLH
jgi:hypothetical protein